MKKYKLMKVWQMILLDVLIFAIALSVFCYFHHIKEMWGVGISEEEQPKMTTLSMFTKPTQVAQTKPPVISKPGSDDKVPGTDGTGNSNNTNGGVTEPVTPPIIIDQGDFGAKFADKFLEEGKVQKTDNTYVSHDINITYSRRTIQYSSSRQVVYYYYDIYIRNIENFYTVSTKNTTRQYLDKIEEYSKDIKDESGNSMYDSLPVLSMNGDLYKINEWPLAVRNGALYADQGYITADIGVLYYDGTFEVVSMNNFDMNKIAAKGPYQIWHFGPGLLDGNGNTKGDKSDDYKTDGATSNGIVGGGNPRAAIGYYEPGHYCFVVVDGRSSEMQNVTIPYLAKIMSGLGCKQAYNLDGGASAQVKFNGVYQRKCDPKKDDQRKLDDIICIGEVKKDN